MDVLVVETHPSLDSCGKYDHEDFDYLDLTLMT